jgi:hypothetical protein
VKRSKGEPPRNMAASVKARLMAVARERKEEFNFLLNRYVLERLLYRLPQSPHVEMFLLKGAMLFTVWSQRPHRATKDIDLLGYGNPDRRQHRNGLTELPSTSLECAASTDSIALRGEGASHSWHDDGEVLALQAGNGILPATKVRVR